MDRIQTYRAVSILRQHYVETSLHPKKMYVTGACGQAHHGSSSRVDFVHEAFLALHGARDYSKLVTETPDRQPYLNCFCCPPNLVRTIAKVSGWAYSLSQDGVAVNLYGGNRLDTHLLDGSAIRLNQETQYPWT